MNSHRAEIFAFMALLLAIVALVIVLQPSMFAKSDLSLSVSEQNNDDFPATFAYQGVLRNASGEPVADGEYNMTLKLYEEPTAGGAPIHTEGLTNVSVRDGLFTVVLGDQPQNGDQGGPLPATQQPLYLGLAVNSEPEMAPRQRIHPVPYALQLTQGVFVADSGNVGIGTTNPALQLDVEGDAKFRDDLAIEGVLTAGDEVGGTKIILNDIERARWGLNTDNYTFGLRSDNCKGQGCGGTPADWPTLFSVDNEGEIRGMAIREVGDGSVTNPTVTTEFYEVTMNRYILEAKDGGTTGSSVPVNDDIVNEFCADVEGCTVYMGMRNWDTAVYGQTGLVVTKGPFRWSVGLADPQGRRRYVLHDWDAAHKMDGLDKDGVKTFFHVPWTGACYLTDFPIVDEVRNADDEVGFWWLNGHDGDFDDPQMVCVLIIED